MHYATIYAFQKTSQAKTGLIVLEGSSGRAWVIIFQQNPHTPAYERFCSPNVSPQTTNEVFQGGFYSALSWLRMFVFLTDECVSDHNERIRSIQIDKNFITETFRMYNLIISRTVPYRPTDD